MADDVSKEDRLLAALSYPFWPLAFLILNLSPVLKRQRFVRYHAFQGFFLGMAIWIGAILLGTAAAFLGRFLWPIGFLYYLFSKLMGLAAFAVTAWSSYQAWTGRCHVLPYITDFAKPFVEEAALAPFGVTLACWVGVGASSPLRVKDRYRLPARAASTDNNKATVIQEESSLLFGLRRGRGCVSGSARGRRRLTMVMLSCPPRWLARFIRRFSASSIWLWVRAASISALFTRSVKPSLHRSKVSPGSRRTP